MPESRSRDAVRRALLRTPAARPLRAVKHRFEPADVKFERAEQARMLALIGEVLTPAASAIDVGASEGAILAEIVRAAPDGRHIAYEPLPDHCARLAARFPDVDVRCAALSDRAGEADFAHVVTRPGWSGFRARPTPDPSDRVEPLTVRTERLDDALPDGLKPALIKIDVEGAEREVLAGMAATLARWRPVVVFEHGLGSADHYGTGPRDVWSLLVDGPGLALFDLEGAGPYSLERFERAYVRRERTNFVARPV